MDTIPLNAAEQELSQLIHRATVGETIIIEAPSGERVRLEPVTALNEDRVPGLLRGQIQVPAKMFEPMSEEELKLWNGEDA